MSDDVPEHPQGDSTTDDGAALRLSVAEERARVKTRVVERVGARIRVRTHEDDVAIAESLRTERVEVERVPVDRIVEEMPEARTEDGVWIVPVVEEVLVRAFHVIEEVRVRTVRESVEHAETVRLRRQVAQVEGDGADTVDASPDAPA